MRWTGPLESAAMLTALPVPARAAPSTRGVLPWAPLIGALLGAAAAAVAVLGAHAVSPLTGAVLGIGVLALITRGLHLDGLADTADGLGPLRDRQRALQVMHAGDVGPFGVVTLVVALLLQASCLAALLPGGWLALPAAAVTARLAMARTGLPGVAMAEGSSLGRAVAGTVSRAWWLGCALVLVAALVGAGHLRWGTELAGAAALGLLVAELVHRRARTRLGGVNGDVMGAMGEIATAVVLLAAAVLR
jgi:adenosylcobinamide-GDP ribazoletransferase